MPARGADGRFIREEGLNFNISIFTILKYLIAFASVPMVQIDRKNRNP